ncbi:glutamate carboxypeptidase 2-like, partial [Saccoglossus kowalevskii]
DFDAALNEFIDAAHSFHQYIVELNEDDPLEVRKINDKLMYLERAFIDPLGLPGRPFHRHLVFAPSSKNSYFGDAFPGLLDALFNIENLPEEEAHQQWKVVDKHLSVLTAFMHGAAITLKEAN